jgi:NAD-dependent dihydropyrimidine dehydrogenase PreA subunit
MTKKHLVVPREHKCIGCGLCMLASSRYEKRKLGIKDSTIVVKGIPSGYKVQIDYGAELKHPDKIVKICPQNCFDIINLT